MKINEQMIYASINIKTLTVEKCSNPEGNKMFIKKRHIVKQPITYIREWSILLIFFTIVDIINLNLLNIYFPHMFH